MREAKWWLRGTKLVQRSSLNRLIPRGDGANAPPYLELDPYVESKAVHNAGAYSVDDGGEDWALFLEDEGVDSAPIVSDAPGSDEWDWSADGAVADATMEIEATAQTSHMDAADWPDDTVEPFMLDDGYDDLITDLTEASTGPVQPNAPNTEASYQDDWDFFDETISLHVVPVDLLQSDEPALPHSDEWLVDDDAIDDLHLIVDDDDDALPPDPITGAPPVDADWLDEEATDDWWHALEDPQDYLPSRQRHLDWPWEDDPGDDLQLIVDDDDDAVGSDAIITVDDAWPWQNQDDTEDVFGLDEAAGITLPALPYQEDFFDEPADDDLAVMLLENQQSADQPPDDPWPWVDDVDDLPPDDQAQQPVVALAQPLDDPWLWDDATELVVVPSGYQQAEIQTLPRQEGDDVQWDWGDDGSQYLLPGGYVQSDFFPPPPNEAQSLWHWDSDYVEDEWTEYIERVGLGASTGADRTVTGAPEYQNLLRRRDDFINGPQVDVLGDQAVQNLLRRRDDFETFPSFEEAWDWAPTLPDEAWWPEDGQAIANNAPVLSQPPDLDAWPIEHEASDDWWEAIGTLEPRYLAPVDPDVLGNQLAQNLLRRRDDFLTDPTRDHDWDFALDAPTEEWETGSGPVVGTQVLFLEFPSPDVLDFDEPQPDNDWIEPSEPVGADAAAGIPRVSEEHDWKHWEDGEGDYEIEPSQPVDAPLLAAPEGWNWDEEATEDGWWHGNTPEVTGDAAASDIPARGISEPDWDWDGESTDADSWWTSLTTPDTDGTPGPDTCPIELAAALARIAELEALLAECRARPHGGGGGASGDGDDIHHGHRHHDGEDAEQRRILDNREREKRDRIARNNNLIMQIVAATVHGLKKPKDEP